MAIEVDFIPVGDGERSGDAICVRFGNLPPLCSPMEIESHRPNAAWDW